MIEKIRRKLFTRLVILKQKYIYIFGRKCNLIFVEGYPESTNFGDALNKPLIEFLAKKKVVFSKYIRKNNESTYAAIGSVVQSIPENTIIWGSGLITDKVQAVPLPKKVHAVRGPKTRKVLMEKGIECPEVYGDPALLLPLIYNPKCDKKYKIGIIPHYLDKDNVWVQKFTNNKDFLIIDLEIGGNYKKVIDELLSCEKIVTSSLHGLIISYAYDIPSCRVKFSDKVIGGDFKFNDFLLSINRSEQEPTLIKENMDIKELVFAQDANIKNYDMKPLILSCPFIVESIKNELVANLVNLEATY